MMASQNSQQPTGNIILPVHNQPPAVGSYPINTQTPPPNSECYKTFDEWQKWVRNEIEGVDLGAQMERLRKYEEMDNFFVGKQLIWWNGTLEDGSWKEVELEEGDPYYASNFMQSLIMGVMAELLNANPELVVDAKSDQWQQVDSANEIKKVIVDEDRRLLTASFMMNTLYDFLVRGNFIWFTGWQPGIGPEYDLPNINMQPTSIDNRFLSCDQCKLNVPYSQVAGTSPASPGDLSLNLDGLNSSQPPAAQMPGLSDSSSSSSLIDKSQSPALMSPSISDGDGDELSGMNLDMDGDEAVPPAVNCPNCSMPMQMAGSIDQGQMPVFGEPEKAQDGDVIRILLRPDQCKADLHGRSLADISFFRVQSSVHKNTAKMLFAGANGQESKIADMDQARVRERRQEASAGNVTGMGGMGSHDQRSYYSTEDKDRNLLRRYWVRPEWYYDTIAKDDWKFKHFTIPAGTRIIDYAPKGLYFVSQGDEILDFGIRLMEKDLVMAKYTGLPTKFWGDGMENLIQLQREYNELRSVELENYFHNATPATVYNPLKIKGSQISGKARALIPLDNPKQGDNPGEFIYQPPPRELGGEISNFRANIKQDASQISTVPISQSGIDGIGGSTATGARLNKDWQNSRLYVRIAPLVEARQLASKQNLELIQKYWMAPRFIKYTGDQGVADTTWIQQHDIQGNFDLSVKDGSWNPRTASEKRDDVMQLLVAGGVPFGVFNDQFPTEPGRVLIDTAGLPELDQNRNHVRKQRDEIEDIIQSVTVAAQAGIDPQMLIMQAAPVEETDNHQVHIDTIKSYLNTPVGRQQPPPIKAMLIEHMHQHLDAQMLQAVQDAQRQMQGAMMAGGMPPGEPGQPGHPGQPPAPNGNPKTANPHQAGGPHPPAQSKPSPH